MLAMSSTATGAPGLVGPSGPTSWPSSVANVEYSAALGALLLNAGGSKQVGEEPDDQRGQQQHARRGAPAD